jgi:hypothetical protein
MDSRIGEEADTCDQTDLYVEPPERGGEEIGEMNGWWSNGTYENGALSISCKAARRRSLRLAGVRFFSYEARSESLSALEAIDP